MPYAIGDTLLTDPVDGAIEISEQAYQTALNSKLDGMDTVVLDGALVIRERAPSPEHVWDGEQWLAPEPDPEPEPEPGPYLLYKSTFIERMDPDEADAFEVALNAHELAKLRLMYHACEYFLSDDPLFAVLHWELVQEFGEDRADELLAPLSKRD